jgi:hypothetical protein
MKVTCKRAGCTLSRAGATLALLLAATAGHAQSPGIAHLLPGSGKAVPASERGQDEPRDRAGKYRQRDLNERLPRTLPNDKLSPDERRRLRQNLYELGREMYQGG